MTDYTDEDLAKARVARQGIMDIWSRNYSEFDSCEEEVDGLLAAFRAEARREWETKLIACERHVAGSESELQEAHGLKALARDEADKLRRHLDAKDHELAGLKAEGQSEREACERIVARVLDPKSVVCHDCCADAADIWRAEIRAQLSERAK